MVLVGEEQKLGIEAAHTGCGECALGLGVFNAEVALAVDAKDGRVPTVHVEVGRGGKGFLHLLIGRLFPGRRAHVPVGEPKFFGFHVLLLGVVDAIVSNENLESFVVIAS